MAKLELVPNEAPFWRASNGQGTVSVSNLELRLPVNEPPGAGGGVVSAPALKILPPGGELAAAFLSKILVTVAGAGSGRVTSTPTGIDCPGTCGVFYPQGTQVTVEAQAAPGSVFTVWSGGGCAGTGSCTVTAAPSTELRATFARQFNLRLIANGRGTIASSSHDLSCSTDCTSAITEGQTVSLSVAAAPGSRFAGWSGACGGTGVCNVTLNGDRTATASFVPITPQPLPPKGVPGAAAAARAVDTEITWIQRKTRRRAVTFHFRSPSGAPEASTFVCRLDRSRARACASPVTYRPISRGNHVFAVAAVDRDGLMDGTPAVYRFRIRR